MIYAGGEDEEETRVNAEEAMDKADRTTLTQCFSNNLYEWGLRFQENSRTPQPRGYQITYAQYPTYYRWDKGTKTWVRRKRINSMGYVGRMRFVPPTAEAMETYYLRILLIAVVGPLSFEYLRKFNGVTYPSYKLACFARGLIEDDSEWTECLAEATLSAMPAQIRQLFTIILSSCCPVDPHQLWIDHRDAMAEDFARRRRQQSGDLTTDIQECDYNLTLNDIKDRLQEYPMSEMSDYGMPEPIPIEVDNITDGIDRSSREVITNVTTYNNPPPPV